MRLNLSESERAELLKRRRLMRQLRAEQKAKQVAHQCLLDRMRAFNASITPEQRRERSLRGWETRRAAAWREAEARRRYDARLIRDKDERETAFQKRANEIYLELVAMLSPEETFDTPRQYWGA